MQNLNFAYINLKTGFSSIRPVNQVIENYAGRAFISHWLRHFIDPWCDPLGEYNDLIIATGLLAGSRASSSTRVSVGAKSPLTKGIKESNVGGKVGFSMSRLNLRSIILHGISKRWSTIHISKNGVKISPADDLVGCDTFTTAQKIISKYGQGVSYIAIGPAGEKCMPSSSIAFGDTNGVPSRHAARGGLAAVMGSKRIKAIVIDHSGSRPITAFDESKLKSAVKLFHENIKANPVTGDLMPKYGTAMLLDVINKIGGLATRNYSSGEFEGADKINGKALYDFIKSRNGQTTHACMPGCLIRCSNVILDSEGNEMNRALEFETMTLLGSNCGIDDLEYINRINRRCDEIGVDTIEIGAAVAVAMEAGLAEFGDSQAVLNILDEIEQGSDLGRLFGNGAKAVGDHFGVKRVPVVKGQSLSAYDPRVLKGTGVTYATSSMGADHTAGNALPNSKSYDGSVPKTHQKDGQVELSAYLQIKSMIFDILGLCLFARSALQEDFSTAIEILNAQHGEVFSYDSLVCLAKEALMFEIEFNNKSDMDHANDLPGFFREEPLPPTNNVFDVEQKDIENLVGFFKSG